MKVKEIIYGAMRLIQVIDNEELHATPQEEQNALSALQMMISSWSARKILLYTTFKNCFDLIGSKYEYTIGNNSVYDFDTVVPTKITNAYITKNGSSFDSSLKAIGETSYFNIKDKSYPAFPSLYYYKYGEPFGMIYLWPSPSEAMSITFVSYKNYPIIANPDIEAEILLPSAYLSALKYNLAIELSAEYATPIPEAVHMLANSSMENIIRLSRKKIPPLKFDNALLNITNSENLLI